MKSRLSLFLGCITLKAIFLLLSEHAIAGGLYLSELGTPGSTGTAGVANPTNTFTADAAWTNPAGMTGLEHDEVLTGLQFVLPWVEFDPSVAEAGGSDGGNAGIFTVAPSLFVVKTLSERARLGFSVAGLLGGGVDYGSDFVGRFSVIKANLAGVGLSPSIAYKINNRLSIGAGVSAVYSVLDEEIAIRQPGFPDGKVKFDKLDDWAPQGFFGLTYQLTDSALLGVVYRTEADIDLEGDVKLRNLAVPFSPTGDIKISWTNPQLVEVGFRYKISNEWMLFANFDWEDWSVFSDNQLGISGGAVQQAAELDRNWKDTWHGGLALAYTRGGHGFSAGVSYDTSPVDDDDRTFDLPVDEQLKFSFAYGRDGKGKLDYAVGATALYAGEAKIDQTSQGVRTKGEFDTNWIFFIGGTLRYVF